MVLDGLVPTDEDKKVRRNLVAFSAAVFLLAWLGIPLSSVAEKLLGSGQVRLHPLRAWVAAAGVLLYLAMRFHFSGGGKTAFKELGKLWLSNVHWGIDGLVKRQSVPDRYLSWWAPPIPEVLARAEAEFVQRGYSGERSIQLTFRQDTSRNEARWTFAGQADVEVTFLNPTVNPPTSIVSHTERIECNVPLSRRITVSAIALWRSWFFSEQAVAWMFPVWLALAASFIVGLRLGQLVFSG